MSQKTRCWFVEQKSQCPPEGPTPFLTWGAGVAFLCPLGCYNLKVSQTWPVRPLTSDTILSSQLPASPHPVTWSAPSPGRKAPRRQQSLAGARHPSVLTVWPAAHPSPTSRSTTSSRRQMGAGGGAALGRLSGPRGRHWLPHAFHGEACSGSQRLGEHEEESPRQIKSSHFVNKVSD